eukprot:544140-Amphidinium_carterae.1
MNGTPIDHQVRSECASLDDGEEMQLIRALDLRIRKWQLYVVSGNTHHSINYSGGGLPCSTIIKDLSAIFSTQEYALDVINFKV